MSDYPHPIIAKEGWPFLIAAVVISIVASFVVGWWSLPLWLLTLFILQFFRDPARAVTAVERAIVSPADGRIVAVENKHDPYLDREALRISVFMNVFNVHSNRAPASGMVSGVWYHPGSFVNASLSKASLENERNAIWIQMADGTDVTCVQVAGLIARRILCYVSTGDRLARGQRYGYIRFGSRVDVYLPTSARAKIVIGDKVYATRTVLAELE